MTEGIFAYGVALGALSNLAVLHGAANLALGFVALDLTLGATEFLAAGRALRGLAHGLADLVTYWLVALPLTFGVAVVSLSAVSAGIGAAAFLTSDIDGH